MTRRTNNPAPSTIRNRRMYERRRQALVDQLGGKCVECDTAFDLTFDHINGRDWDVRKVHGTKRLKIYQREADEGKLQLLCLTCNSRKGKPEDNTYFGPEDE